MAENEKIVNGVISDEALDTIAGGAGISSSKLKKLAIGAGITVVAAGALAGAGVAGYKMGNKKGSEEGYKQGHLKGYSEGYNQSSDDDEKMKGLPDLFDESKTEENKGWFGGFFGKK